MTTALSSLASRRARVPARRDLGCSPAINDHEISERKRNMKADKIIYGNIYTVDKIQPKA
jgi:hypothetical protein